MSINQEKTKAISLIKKEYIDLLLNPIQNIQYTINLGDDDNLFEWKLQFIGPKDTPYEGGLFLVKIKFPEDYPSNSPIPTFITPIYHPDVNKRKLGMEDFDLLGYIPITKIMFWDPTKRKISEIIQEINDLFYNATCEHPYGIEFSHEYRNNKELFDKKAKYFTQKYANPVKSHNVYEDKDWDFSYPE